MKICIPLTARPHLARQALLINELKKYFEVVLFKPKEKQDNMAVNAIFYAIEFNNYLNIEKPDILIIRGDRYEMLALAMVGTYKNIPIVHIEGGDLSGVIDNKIRHAITQLSRWHFCTNEESHQRLIAMGVKPTLVYNYGSLDVEFASKVKKRKIKDNYILIAYHPIPMEDPKQLEIALQNFAKYDIVRITSNKDYGVIYGQEQYSPEDYINLMRYAKCCVGNSSSLLKEASILGVGVVNIGNRQYKRLKPNNVIDVYCSANDIRDAIKYQLGKRYKKDNTYYQNGTSKKIAKKLSQVI